MTEKTKRKKAVEGNEPTKSPAEKKESGELADWSRDQQEKSYYYDDSHGYEIYNPEDDEDD